MSAGREPVEAPPKRRAMTPARKRRIWLRENGICWICKQPVDQSGPGVRYDHFATLWITRSDDDATIFPIHRKGCDEAKTPRDQANIAKVKRLIQKSDPATRKPARMKSGRKLQGRGFDKRLSKGFDGKVRPRGS